MYFAQITKDRIKTQCKIKKINAKKMLIDLELGPNAIQQINDVKGMASYSLAKVADYLDCSVDYLLGRTDVPEVNYGDIYEEIRLVAAPKVTPAEASSEDEPIDIS